MNVTIFCHSLRSDWNHGNAHFLRGVVSELQARGVRTRVLEPENSWSLQNLVRDHGPEAAEAYREAYPDLRSETYSLQDLDLDETLAGSDVVIVHEWSDPELVARIGRHRRRGGRYVLLFHDTHHRSVTARHEMQAYDLSGFDGVLAFGRVIRDLYLAEGWTKRAWVWHEAADDRVFRPILRGVELDLVWIGNWGDEERTEELHEFLLRPVRGLGLRARVYGVRYPAHAIEALASHGIEYGGYLPNHRVPEVFASAKVTVHVPRRPYVRRLPGIPTIRPFEAMACGIPFVSSPWDDAEGLFTPGSDYLVARDGEEMKRQLSGLLTDPDRAQEQADRGRRTVLARHTCRHRVEALLDIVRLEASEVAGIEVGV